MSDTTDNQNPPDSQVINLSKERKKRAKPSEEERDKKRKVFLDNMLTQMVNASLGLPSPFKHRYKIHLIGELQLIFEYVENGIAKFSSFKEIVYALEKMISDIGPHFIYTHKDYTETVKTFLDCSAVREFNYPKTLLDKDDPGIAFFKLPYSLKTDWNMRQAEAVLLEKCPVFSDFIGRCHDPMAVCAFIGSIFEPYSDRSQYLWLYGDGQNGKSQLFKFLLDTLTSNLCTMVMPPDTFNSSHWTEMLVGKRLALMDDVENFGFVAKGIFKSVTGLNYMSVNRKFKPGCVEPADVKFIITSNRQPFVKRTKADQRRAIYIEISPLPENVYTPNIAARMFEEAEHFYKACFAIYRHKCPDFGFISYDTSRLDKTIDDQEEHFQSLFDKYFIYTGKETDAVTINMVVQILKKENELNNKSDFYRFLKTKYKITDEERRKSRRISGVGVVKCIGKIKLTNSFDRCTFS